MRSARRMACILLFAALVAACDSTQPLQADLQTYVLRLEASGATVPVYNVYDMFQDNNGDSLADDVDGDGEPDFWLFCRTRTVNPVVWSSSNSIPYNFTIEVSILGAGETQSELLTSAAARTDALLNLTEYDTNTQPSASVPGFAPVVITNGGTTRTFRFQNGRTRSAAVESIVMATNNPLSDGDPGNYGAVGAGRCSSFYPGPTRIDEAGLNTYPLEIPLAKGETVSVKLRRDLAMPVGFPVLNDPGVAISASFTLNGRPVVVRGTTVTEAGSGGGLAFTFTTR